MLKPLVAFLLLALTVLIHAAGLALVMRLLPASKTMAAARFGPRTWLFIRLAAWAIVIHVIEIAMWAFFFWSHQCLPDFESSFYFSSVTYTTLGYGDIVLPPGIRLFAGLEALIGILMCGWSTGVFFSVVSRLHTLHPRTDD